MTRPTILLGAVVLLFLSALASPGSAQHVISNPGYCAQFYPNANCQNYGRGNPYTSYGWRRAGHRHYWGHRHYRRHWH
jgi:hypothetical protein